MRRLTNFFALTMLFSGGGVTAARADDLVLQAMVDELARGMKELRLPDLPPPFHIRIVAEERHTHRLGAKYGSIINSDRRVTRGASSRIRVGSFELDNTNIGFGFGGRTNLPLEDDYGAIRQAIWLMLDRDYKRSVEALTRKTAFLRQKNVVDRPHDYVPGGGAVHLDSPEKLAFDHHDWAARLERLSERFSRHTYIQDSQVRLVAGTSLKWLVDSEGSQIRVSDTGLVLSFRADMQAQDGMRIRDSHRYLAEHPGELPELDAIERDIDKMCAKMLALSEAPILEEYSGPVLFPPTAAGRVFSTLLTDKLAARPIPVGRGGAGDPSLARKIGRRILPRSFSAYDDPKLKRFEDELLAGAYDFDDEGVVPQRVALVERGILKTLVAGRAPTRQITGTTGHARSSRFADPVSHIGCLYLEDAEGKTEEELNEALRTAARDEGLEYGLRVEELAPGRGGMLGHPTYAYRVDVETGEEQLVRGMEFAPVETRELKRLLAGGRHRGVYNDSSGVSMTVVSPAILFEELELTKIETEHDRLPILASPRQRKESN